MLKNKYHVYGGDSDLVPKHGNYGLELFQNMCSRKDQLALVNSDTGETMTFGELAQQTVDIALSLARMGIGKGHAVSVCSEKRIEVIPAMMGIICAGATFIAADITGQKTAFLHRVNISKPHLMFLSPSGYDAHIEALRTVDYIKSYVVFGEEEKKGATLLKDFVTEHGPLEDFRPAGVGWHYPVNIMFSSGTTGLPKALYMTHLNLLSLTRKLANHSMRDGKVILNTREWYYTYGLMHTQAALNAGCTIVFSPKNEIEDLLKAVEKYKVSVIQVCPSTTNEFAKSEILQNYDISSVEYMLSGGTVSDDNTSRVVRQRFPNLVAIYDIYGMSEAGLVCGDLFLKTARKPGSAGRVMDGVVIKVVDINTRETLGPNQRGEICLKSVDLMSGYLGNVLIDPFDEEGFYKTGDVGYYDEDQFIFVVQRIKDIIKFNDISVAPAEFEAILVQHPAVKEAGVIGAPHELHGEVPTAFVVLQPAAVATAEEIVEFVNSHMSYKTKLVGGVRVVKKLPYQNAKLDRKALALML